MSTYWGKYWASQFVPDPERLFTLYLLLFYQIDHRADSLGLRSPSRFDDCTDT